MTFLMQKGKLYLPYNGNLLIHGCIPVDENGEMESMTIDGEKRYGRNLLDYFETHVRKAFDNKEISRYMVAQIVLEEMKKYKDIAYPELPPDIEKHIELYKEELANEKP